MLSKVRPLLTGWKLGDLTPNGLTTTYFQGHPWDSHKTKATTRIYIWGVLRDDTVRPTSQGSGRALAVSSLSRVQVEALAKIDIYYPVQWSVLKI